MRTRTCTSSLDINVTREADITFLLAVHRDFTDVDEDLTFTVDGEDVAAKEITDSAGARLHRLRACPAGQLEVRYRAEVRGEATPEPVDPIDEIYYTRQSRYCDSDRLASLATMHFRGLQGMELLTAVTRWVHQNIRYAPGSSRFVDGALETYLARQGVCRDFAHLVITFLRALNVPARMTAVYAPGLDPMDFHAVAEAAVDGQWYVLDATGLAPRDAMVRIVSGRDASDTAFMTTLGGRNTLRSIRVDAHQDEATQSVGMEIPVTLT